jgi:hypothetical protein
MITVLAIDALELALVEEVDLIHLKQKFHGKTNISEFSEPRTMVLWSSFMTGKNMEVEVLEKGDKEMWNIQIDHNDTFFSHFENPCIIDLPGYNYDLMQHNKERTLLKSYFDSEDSEKETIRKNYNDLSFEHHRKIKERFFNSLNNEHDFILGYFSVIDVIGHLNFGNKMIMKMLYREFDEIASKVSGDLLILSDHGMKAIGQFGDHSEYGFWGSNFFEFGLPKITDFAKIISSKENK